MPLLAAWLGNLFGGLVAFLARFVGVKLAARTLGVAGMVAAIAALMALFNTQIAPLVAQAFSTSYGAVIGLAFPPIAGTCLATITTVWVGCATYKLQRDIVAMSSNV